MVLLPSGQQSREKKLKFCTEVNKTLNKQLETPSLLNTAFEVILWERLTGLEVKTETRQAAVDVHLHVSGPTLNNMKGYIQIIQ